MGGVHAPSFRTAQPYIDPRHVPKQIRRCLRFLLLQEKTTETVTW
jgi:hypothetical protein